MRCLCTCTSPADERAREQADLRASLFSLVTETAGKMGWYCCEITAINWMLIAR